MTAPPLTAEAVAQPTLAEEVGALLAQLEAQPHGQVSTSVYETGRLVADTPWVAGHPQRLAYLLAEQGDDGSWGPAGGYALVPTASAVQALLASLVRCDPPDPAGPDRAAVAAAATRGLIALARHLGEGTALPDTPAADLIVPTLVARIDTDLVALAGDPALTGAPAALPRIDRRRVEAVDALLAGGRPVPSKLWHAYEVLGPAAAARTEVAPIEGAVGASPAATAVWLSHRGAEDRAARAYLDAVVARHNGPVPCCAPITVFERSWALANLARAGVPVRPGARLVAELVAALGPEGAATGPGLPADADTTSTTLYALARLGHPVDPVSLLRYDLGSHFCTWQGEDGQSITTNAHVLETLGWHARYTTDGADRYAARVRSLAGWLREVQQPDGLWVDRWHASPYYATHCAVSALAAYAPPEVAHPAIDRAVDRILATQREDGGWGRWSTTTEETAYAVQILLAGRRPIRPEMTAAVRRAFAQLHVNRLDHPPLWHDKDLYAPILIVRSAVIAARKLAHAAVPTFNQALPATREAGTGSGMITTA
ncbi:prenyltransferase/squalene oxidase repeat-containing protein [Micromonospora sp. NPDC048871]|uniref:prenyltransferase/squalene oxidase repeat-containing protein n=1 Tax=Micromonospora sp. NPDC048871 TaxID=3364259 RepID=UPI0037127E9E